ncbi:MAG: monomethylamine:corrinoid methyltransferase, partial [Clostridiales bacterium]
MYVTYEEILNRSETGPLMKEEDYDRRIGKVARELTKKYQIKYTRDILVNYDDAMADRLFEAAIDFIVQCGVYVSDYNRVIEFTREEVLDTIAGVRTHVQYGRNKDAANVVKRTVESHKDPFIVFSPVGNPVDENVFQRFIMHYAQERITDAIFSPVLTTYHG